MTKSSLLISILSILFFPITMAQLDGELVKIKKNLYMITGLGSNVTFLVTQSNVVVVDAGTVKSDALTIKEYIKSVTPNPIKYLIISDYHPEHSGGACGFDLSTTIISHVDARKNARIDGQAQIDQYIDKVLGTKITYLRAKLDSLKRIDCPNIYAYRQELEATIARFESGKKTNIYNRDLLFNNSLSLVLDNDTILLKHYGTTHAQGSICVIFPTHNAIATSDLFYNKHVPTINCNSDIDNWINTLDLIISEDYNYYIPALGEVGTSKNVAESAQFIVELKKNVNKAIKTGVSAENLSPKIEMKNYLHYKEQNKMPCAIYTIYNNIAASKN